MSSSTHFRSEMPFCSSMEQNLVEKYRYNSSSHNSSLFLRERRLFFVIHTRLSTDYRWSSPVRLGGKGGGRGRAMVWVGQGLPFLIITHGYVNLF